MYEKGVKVAIIGDVTHIREKAYYNKVANQKIHQWPFAKSNFMLTYKLNILGIDVKMMAEHYTSQTCPQCGHLTKSKNRNFRCSFKECGAKYHRDAVGAYNIRAKYLGNYNFPVVGVIRKEISGMASPLGVRFHPHLSCNSLKIRQKCRI